MKKGTFKFILIVVFITGFINAFAQKNDSTRTYKLEEVIVTSTRNQNLVEKTPEILHVITSREIEALQVSSTGEILEYLTGVNVESGTGSGFPDRSIVSLDGFPANYSLVMVDGVRLLSEHIHTGQNIDLIPPENIERIEIIKGAASAQYGSDAMGGVVNIITKKVSEKSEGSVSFDVGSYGTLNSTVSSRTLVNKNVGISSFVNYKQSEGTPVLAPTHRIGNMGYTKFNTMQNLSWRINEKSGLNSSIIYGQNSMEFRDDIVYSKLLMPSMDYNLAIGNNVEVTARVKYSHWEAELSSEKNQLLNPEIFFSWNKFENNIITIGGDYRFNSFTRTSVLKKNQEAYGFFMQDEIELSKFSFLLALRFDKVENVKLVTSPKIAAMFQMSDKMRVRASFGRGFHAPTVQELYEEGYGHSGRAYRFGNTDLKPEYSLTTTLGLELIPLNNLEVIIYGYYNTITDMITPIYDGIWDENPDPTVEIDKWVRTNIHKAEILGFEAAVRFNLNTKILLEAGYNYADNKNISTGGQLPYYPGQSFYTKLNYNYYLGSDFSGSYFVSLRMTKDRSAWSWKPESDAAVDNTEGLITDLRDYELLNAGMKISYKNKIDVYLNVGNILGQDIEKLDDSFTVIDGEPVCKVGCIVRF